MISVFHILSHVPASAASWGAFAAGQGIHVFVRADLSKRSKINGIKTRREWIGSNLASILVRSFASFALWGYAMVHPDVLSHAVSSVGLPFNLAIDGTPPVAGLAGLGMNHGLDYIGAKLGFQKEIPPLNGDTAQPPVAPQP